MLVLSRKLGEKITIDGEIELQVLEVNGNRVRLGILAPQQHRIVRSERLASESGGSGEGPKRRLAGARF